VQTGLLVVDGVARALRWGLPVALIVAAAVAALGLGGILLPGRDGAGPAPAGARTGRPDPAVLGPLPDGYAQPVPTPPCAASVNCSATR
jgi:hypothetical protein